MITIKDNYVYSMSSENRPAMKIQPGERICLETLDCFSGQLKDESGYPGNFDDNLVNPATGPVYIDGAKPGDILKIRIENICISDCGVMTLSEGGGIFDEYITKPQIKMIPVSDGFAQFSENIKIPVQPMIGVIGTAPEFGAVDCCEPGNHGGNMDNRRIQKGAVLYLPVFHQGALLSAGDVHASMGDGEVCGTGIEISAKVTLKVDLIKSHSESLQLKSPLLEDEDCYYTIASEHTLDEAVKTATIDMCKILERELSLTKNESAMLISAVCDTKICQLVDPKITATVAVPKHILKEIHF